MEGSAVAGNVKVTAAGLRPPGLLQDLPGPVNIYWFCREYANYVDRQSSVNMCRFVKGSVQELVFYEDNRGK